MKTEAVTPDAGQIAMLLRGEAEPITQWLEQWNPRRALLYLGVIFVGAGIYGAGMGIWRAPQQAVYTAIKFPLILLLTTLGNALLNGMLAPLLGLNLRFHQSLQAILISFAIAAAVLGAFSPLIFFLVWNLPPMTAAVPADAATYNFLIVAHVAIIAFAGVAANWRLMQLLRRLSGDAGVARRVFFAWLAVNLLLGSQLGWILRPFFGSPSLEVQFLRDYPLQGNFYESVFRAVRDLFLS